MLTNRRTFLGAASASALGAGLSASPAAALLGQEAQAAVLTQAVLPKRAGKKLRVLVLGGTRFLGPAVVEEALARGHEVTLFNRGKSNPHLFPGLEKLVGDRDPNKGEGLKALVGREFDAVLDTCAYVPRISQASAKLLSGHAAHYCLVSSISVYESFGKNGIDETAPVGVIGDPTMEEVTGESYGPLKALTEYAATAAFAGRTTMLRPGYIVGPRDRTHRFSYWPIRVAQGGEILVPGDGLDPLQYIDVRDLAGFMLHTVEAEITGTLNVVGPEAQTNMAELAYGCKAVTGGDARFTWVDADFLAAKNVHLPIWSTRSGDSPGIGTVSHARALAAGLTFTTLAETVRDTFRYLDGLEIGDGVKDVQALQPKDEAAVLAAWHGRTSATTDAVLPVKEKG